MILRMSLHHYVRVWVNDTPACRVEYIIDWRGRGKVDEIARTPEKKNQKKKKYDVSVQFCIVFPFYAETTYSVLFYVFPVTFVFSANLITMHRYNIPNRKKNNEHIIIVASIIPVCHRRSAEGSRDASATFFRAK